MPTPGHDVSVRLGSITSHHKKVAFLGIGDPSVPFLGMGTQPEYDFPFHGEHQQRLASAARRPGWRGPSGS